MMFETDRLDGVLRAARPGTDWLATTWNGGYLTAAAAFNITVPEGWHRTDLDAYVEERLNRAGFDEHGPAMLTGVDQAHARGARKGSSVAIATCGLSNPTTLPMDPEGGPPEGNDEAPPAGTVNLIIGTRRALAPGGLATLLAVATEARTATLMAETGFTGTTTDAVVVGCDPAGDFASFTGSGTVVGAEVRVCVREAIRASLQSRYRDREMPRSVADARYGSVSAERATEFVP